jgi:hypothetical protein
MSFPALYTIIVSSSYFAQKRVWLIVGMFALLLILTVISLRAFWPVA